MPRPEKIVHIFKGPGPINQAILLTAGNLLFFGVLRIPAGAGSGGRQGFVGRGPARPESANSTITYRRQRPSVRGGVYQRRPADHGVCLTSFKGSSHARRVNTIQVFALPEDVAKLMSRTPTRHLGCQKEGRVENGFEREREITQGLTVTLLSFLFLASATASLATAQTSAPRQTVWDGVYTDAQAARGTTAAKPGCSRFAAYARGGGQRAALQKTILEEFRAKNSPVICSRMSAGTLEEPGNA